MGADRQRLVDLAIEPIRIATSLPAGGGSDPAVLRTRCESALGEFAAQAARAGHQAEGVDAARYALVALIDERAMSPASPVRSAWLDQPLQLLLFESFAAGEEFYRRLERWRRPRTPADAEVLEVFQACLALGFRGMMVGEQHESARRQLAEQMANEVLSLRGGLSAELSPQWRPEAAGPAGAIADAAPRWPLWVVPLASIVAVVIAWAVAHAWAVSAASRAVAELR